MPNMLVRALAALALMLCLGAGPSAVAAQRSVLAQASPDAGQTDVTGDLPSGTWLLVVVGIGVAVYISYRLGQKQEAARRREGPMSRALRAPTTPKSREER
jgi:hypothetical protein